MAITTDLDKFRLELGDTDEDAPLFNDVEVQYFLGERPGQVLLAVADACDSLARRYTRRCDVEEDGQRFALSQIAKGYRDQAKDLRKRASGIGVIQTTRVDGYSEDIGGRDGAGAASPRTGRVRSGYYSPDLPY